MDLKDILNDKGCLPAKVISLDKELVTAKNGFLSDITSLTLHLENGEAMHLIMKTPLKPNEEEKQLFSEVGQAVNVFELDFYEKVYPELHQVMTELHLPSPLPKCYYAGVIEDGLVFILEDLTRRGLQMPSFKIEFPESDLRLILRSLASVQAGACALQLRRQASLLELFPFLKKNEAIVGIEELCAKNNDLCKLWFIEEYPDQQNLVELLSTIAMDTDILKHFFCGYDADFFLSHGDLWNNNLFINGEECIFIDWQCVSGGCSIGDIAKLVGFGADLGPEPSKRFESLVRIYLDFLVECCGDNSALREMVEQRIVPFMSSTKMQKLSLQFFVKFYVAAFEVFNLTDNNLPTFMNAGTKTRVKQNMYNILLELSQ